MYYLGENRDINFGVGPTIRLCSPESVAIRFHYYDVKVVGLETPWRVRVRVGTEEYRYMRACSYGEAEYLAEQAINGSYWDEVVEARPEYKCRRHGWVSGWDGQCGLCEQEYLDGWDMEPSREEPHDVPCDVCGVAPATPGNTRCAGCIAAGRRTIAFEGTEPCGACLLACDNGPEDHCPF